jgi:hypothetical protein
MGYGDLSEGSCCNIFSFLRGGVFTLEITIMYYKKKSFPFPAQTISQNGTKVE